MRWVVYALFVGVLVAGPLDPAAAEERVALVVGNGAYRHTAALPNPVNDATGIAAALQRLDFAVTLVVDADKRAIDDALRKFARALRGAKVGLFYYAGHGLQVDGTNYLVPVDAQLTDEADLEFEANDIDRILRLMEKSSAVNLLFLDACRDNPMAQTLATAMRTRSTTVGRGLAGVEGATGTLIVYATRPGNVAEDGTGPHSPFTAALLQHIETPGIEVRQMLSRVRDSVLRATNERQQPWDHSSLRGDFYFRSVPPTTSAVAPAPEPLVADKEALFWQSIKDSTDAEDFEAYLTQFPAGTFAALARNRIKALRPTQPEQVAATDAPIADQPQQTAALAIPDTAYLEEAERALNLSREQRQRVQRALTLLGFDTKGADGAFGGRTRQAVSAWQASRHEAGTGYFDAPTFQALLTQAEPQLAAWDKAEAERRDAELRAAEAQRQEEEARQGALRKAEEEELRAKQQAVLVARERYGTLPEAVGSRNVAAVRALLAAGEDPNATDEAGQTILHVVAGAGNAQIAEILLAAGAQPNARNAVGETPLHLAMRTYYSFAVPSLAPLRAAGADLNAQSDAGLTPLHVAVRSRNIGGVRSLLAAGADPNRKTNEGQTALDLARLLDYSEIVNLLRERSGRCNLTC